MKGSFSLVKDQLVGTSQEDRHSLALVGATCHLDNLAFTSSSNFFNKSSTTELFLGEVIDVGYGSGSSSFRYKIDLISINILYYHDILFGKEVEGQFIDCISKN